MESIPQEAFEPFIQQEGCPAYHPRIMLKIILCAYTQTVFSGRKIEALLKDSIRMVLHDPSFHVQSQVKEFTEIQRESEEQLSIGPSVNGCEFKKISANS